MIELERHIEILLLSNDCVIVPDLGGFMAHYVSARYDETDGLFLPPLRTLGFNPQLKMNDSLLVQSYIEAYDISYPEALRRIESEVQELRQHLDTEGEYELNDIGKLHINDEGHLEFTPCEAGILTPELYGLSSFEMSPVTTSSVVLHSVTPLQLPSAEESDTVSSAVEEPLDENSEEKVEKPSVTGKPAGDDTIVIKMSWLRNTAAIAAAIIAFFIVQTPVSNSYMQTEVLQSSVLPFALNNETAAEKVQPKEELKAERAVVTEKAVVNEAPVQAPKAEPVTVQQPQKPAAETQPAYCIVLASQTSPKNAGDYINHLKKDGYNDVYTMNMQNSKMVRVVYGRFHTQEEAYNELRTLHKNKSMKDAWVLHVH